MKTSWLGLLGLWAWQHARGSHRGRVGVRDLQQQWQGAGGKQSLKSLSSCVVGAQQPCAGTGDAGDTALHGQGCCGTIKSAHVGPPGAPSVPHVDVSDPMLLP